MPKIYNFGIDSADEKFFSPERFAQNSTNWSEIYAFGFLMCEIVSGGKPEHPFDIENITSVRQYIQDPENSPIKCLPRMLENRIDDQEYAKIFLDIFKEIWAFGQNRRPTFNHVKCMVKNIHDFLNK